MVTFLAWQLLLYGRIAAALSRMSGLMGTAPFRFLPQSRTRAGRGTLPVPSGLKSPCQASPLVLVGLGQWCPAPNSRQQPMWHSPTTSRGKDPQQVFPQSGLRAHLDPLSRLQQALLRRLTGCPTADRGASDRRRLKAASTGFRLGLFMSPLQARSEASAPISDVSPGLTWGGSHLSPFDVLPTQLIPPLSRLTVSTVKGACPEGASVGCQADGQIGRPARTRGVNHAL